MDVTYTFYLDNVGLPATGLNPVFEVFYDLDESVNHWNSGTTPIAEDIVGSTAALPQIVELGGGFYFFVFDWSSFSGDFYLTKIDCGASNFANPQQSSIILKLDRNDNLHNVAKDIRDSSNSLINSNNELLGFVKRLLEVEQGTWKIELDSGLYYLRLYPTKNATETSPVYETGLAVDVPIAEYKLQDENGLSSATNPFVRLQNGIIKPIS